MNFLKKLAQRFSPVQQRNRRYLVLQVRCKVCGEIIPARIDLWNELDRRYAESDGTDSYHVRKVLIGSQRCFRQIELELDFDLKHNLRSSHVSGGEIVEEKSLGETS